MDVTDKSPLTTNRREVVKQIHTELHMLLGLFFHDSNKYNTSSFVS